MLAIGKGELTKEAAEEFLNSYGDFGETVTEADIAELGAVLNTLREVTCGALEGADTVAGATVAAVAAGSSTPIYIQPFLYAVIRLVFSLLSCYRFQKLLHL